METDCGECSFARRNEAALTNLTSYIPTTSATITRRADNLILPVSASQVPLDRGTIIFEFIARPLPAARVR